MGADKARLPGSRRDLIARDSGRLVGSSERAPIHFHAKYIVGASHSDVELAPLTQNGVFRFRDVLLRALSSFSVAVNVTLPFSNTRLRSRMCPSRIRSRRVCERRGGKESRVSRYHASCIFDSPAYLRLNRPYYSSPSITIDNCKGVRRGPRDPGPRSPIAGDLATRAPGHFIIPRRTRRPGIIRSRDRRPPICRKVRQTGLHLRLHWPTWHRARSRHWLRHWFRASARGPTRHGSITRRANENSRRILHP